MSDSVSSICPRPAERQARAGSGFVLAALIGFTGIALAITVWVASDAWLWALATWLLASPAGVGPCVIASLEPDPDPAACCESGGCLRHHLPPSFHGAQNA